MAEGVFQHGTIDVRVRNLSADVLDVFGEPNVIIRDDQAWRIHVHWHTDGLLPVLIEGFWHLEAYLESIGAGPELEVPQMDVPIVNTNPANYDVVMLVPAGTVDVPAGEPTLPMRIVVTVTAHAGPLGTLLPIAGHVEGPIITFFKP